MNSTELIHLSGNPIPLEKPDGYKILFLVFLGQTAMSIAFNWVRKIRYLIRTDIRKLFAVFAAVTLQYFYYSYYILEMPIEVITDNSVFWIMSISLLIIDLCVHPE